MDVSWLKPHLGKMFAINPTNQNIQELIQEKINHFNGKLYKYFSFSNGDLDYSLSNLENGVLYFSKPDHFNDPFDCALGFSIDAAFKALLPKFIDEKINIDGEHAESIKDFIKNLLCGTVSNEDYDTPTGKLLSLLYSNPKFKDIFRRLTQGEKISDTELQAKIFEALTVEGFANQFFSIITDSSKIDITALTESDAMNAILSLIQRNPEVLISSGIQLDDKTTDLLSVINSIFAEESIIDRIERIAEVTNYRGIDIKAEVTKIKNTLKPVLPQIKQIINNNFAITCFSETPDNILMWSHYADKHSGFCVE